MPATQPKEDLRRAVEAGRRREGISRRQLIRDALFIAMGVASVLTLTPQRGTSDRVQVSTVFSRSYDAQVVRQPVDGAGSTSHHRRPINRGAPPRRPASRQTPPRCGP